MRGSYVCLILLGICAVAASVEDSAEIDVGGEYSDAAELTDDIGKKDDGSGFTVTTKSHFGVGYKQTTVAPPTSTTTARQDLTSDPDYVSTPRPTPTSTTIKIDETLSTTESHLTKSPKGAESAVSEDSTKTHQEEISEATLESSTKWKNFGMIAVLLAGLSLMLIGCWRFKVEGDSLKESFLEEAEAALDVERN